VKGKRPDTIVVISLPIHDGGAISRSGEDEKGNKDEKQIVRLRKNVQRAQRFNTDVGSASARCHVAGASHYCSRLAYLELLE